MGQDRSKNSRKIKFLDVKSMPLSFFPIFTKLIFKARCNIEIYIEQGQLTFSCSKSTIETLEKDVKYVQS